MRLAICLAETDLFGFYVYGEDGQVKSMDVVTNVCDHTQPKTALAYRRACRGPGGLDGGLYYAGVGT